MKNKKQLIRYGLLVIFLLLVWLTQMIPFMGKVYAYMVYPVISYCLSAFSQLIPFALGDLFIFLYIMGIIVFPVYARLRRKKLSWKKILLRDGEYILWLYVWFYLGWGLNYSQPDFYQRTGISRITYNEDTFRAFVNEYIDSLNCSYTSVDDINEPLVCKETVRIYNVLSDSLGVHRPPHDTPRVKTMIFSRFNSMVRVTGSMSPFFNEFTINGNVRPSGYPATYAHELAHLLGITSEAEANFYAYQVCTRSQVADIRFSGYFSVYTFVLRNARKLLTKDEYAQLYDRIRPEIVQLYKENGAYWASKYNPFVGTIRDWMYDLYLKGNKITSGKKNYSEVIGLLISYREHNHSLPCP